MLSVYLRVLFVLVAIIAAACRQAEPPPAAQADVAIEMAVEPQPPLTGTSTLHVTVTGASGSPINDAVVSARGDMSHAGMVPVIAEVEGGVAGLYAIPFEWTMAGDWFVDVIVTLPDGRTVQERFDLTVGGEAEPHEPMTSEADHG